MAMQQIADAECMLHVTHVLLLLLLLPGCFGPVTAAVPTNAQPW
jgi:hypothetical protein